MIEIISGIDPVKGGYERKIWSSHKGTENFMSEIIGNGKPEAVDSIVYSIHFVNKYFVFSKNKIVRDTHGSDRIGTFSFSIALETANGIDILALLNAFEEKYDNGGLDFSKSEDDKPSVMLSTCDGSSKRIKKNKKAQERDKDIVYLYYKDETELKEYFKRNSAYRKFKSIFFIEEKYEVQDNNNPLKSIQYKRKINFEELTKEYDPNPQKGKKKDGEKSEIKSYLTNRLVFFPLLVGMLLGITGFWGYQWLSSDDVVKHDNNESNTNYIADLNSKITQKDNEIKVLEDSIKNIYKNNTETPKTIVAETSSGGKGKSETNTTTTESPENTEIETFLKTGCKTMTLNGIEKKIRELDPNWRSNKSLISFAAFITVLKKNPPTKKKLEDFKSNHQSNFKDNHEYVKLFNYMDTNYEKIKTINVINQKKLSEIETIYGFSK
jgi:nitrate reductase NapE component